jgi:hypothetical protein
MATVSFRCIEETSEASPSDSPYFLIYAGDGQHLKSDVQRVRRESWDDDVDAGEPTRTANVQFTGVTDFDLVLVALLEEDWDNDLTSARVSDVRDAMNNLDTLLQPSVVDDQINEFKTAFANAIKKHTPNDDLIKMKRISNNQFTDFKGDGAHYRVKFAA